MHSDHHYDYIIVGGGASGLSLVFHLTLSTLSQKKVLLIDKKAKTENDRTWCFWTDKDLPYQCAKEVSWNSLSFFTEKFAKRQKLHPLKYVYINSLAFYKEMAQHLAQYPNIETKVAKVSTIKEEGNQARVYTDEGTYTADWVFDSRVKLPTYSPNQIFLWQQFHGWWIETPNRVFDPTCATLMDFRVSQGGAVYFMYLLPISETKALVECTSFAGGILDWEMYKGRIRTYLNQKIRVRDFSIGEVEYGFIPMTNYAFPKESSGRIISIGKAAGLTKPSTGYTFLNIQKDSQQIVRSLERRGNPYQRGSRKGRYKFYDNLLLYLIKNEPENIPHIFSQLFRKNEFQKILNFLSEDTSLMDDLRVIIRLPWSPFLRALSHYHFFNRTAGGSQPQKAFNTGNYERKTEINLPKAPTLDPLHVISDPHSS